MHTSEFSKVEITLTRHRNLFVVGILVPQTLKGGTREMLTGQMAVVQQRLQGALVNALLLDYEDNVETSEDWRAYILNERFGASTLICTRWTDEGLEIAFELPDVLRTNGEPWQQIREWIEDGSARILQRVLVRSNVLLNDYVKNVAVSA